MGRPQWDRPRGHTTGGECPPHQRGYNQQRKHTWPGGGGKPKPNRPSQTGARPTCLGRAPHSRLDHSKLTAPSHSKRAVRWRLVVSTTEHMAHAGAHTTWSSYHHHTGMLSNGLQRVFQASQNSVSPRLVRMGASKNHCDVYTVAPASNNGRYIQVQRGNKATPQDTSKHTLLWGAGVWYAYHGVLYRVLPQAINQPGKGRSAPSQKESLCQSPVLRRQGLRGFGIYARWLMMPCAARPVERRTKTKHRVKEPSHPERVGGVVVHGKGRCKPAPGGRWLHCRAGVWFDAGWGAPTWGGGDEQHQDIAEELGLACTATTGRRCRAAVACTQQPNKQQTDGKTQVHERHAHTSKPKLVKLAHTWPDQHKGG